MKKRNQKYICILVILAVVFLSLFMLLKDKNIPKERNISTYNEGAMLCLLDVDKDSVHDGYELPEGLVEWIARSLENGDWDKRLKEISAEYKKISSLEKSQYFTEQEAEDYYGLAHYCLEIEPLLLKDIWYLVSLSEEGNDLVIESYDWEGEKCIYVFINFFGTRMQYTEPPMWAMEANPIGSPYFISWDEHNYMAVPVWKEESDKLLGIEVYDYDPYMRLGVITGIRVDDNGKRKVKSQEYLFTLPQGLNMGEVWSLGVLSDDEE